MSTTANSLIVGMAEIKVARHEARFTCLGLGSCIGIAALDPVAKVGGMIHIMLPEAFPGKVEEKVGKFADTGIPAFLEELYGLGASRNRLRIALAGGAQVFQFGNTATPRMEIGARNAAAVDKILAAHSLRPIARDVGGSKGRTMVFTLETGEIRLRLVDQGERELCNLMQ